MPIWGGNWGGNWGGEGIKGHSVERYAQDREFSSMKMPQTQWFEALGLQLDLTLVF